MKMFKIVVVVLAILSADHALASSQEAKKIYIPRFIETDEMSRYQYFIELLDAALMATKEDGKYEFVISDEDTSYSKVLEDLSLQKGGLTLAWSPISKGANKSLLPIEVPLYKGILGARVLIVTKKNLEKFKPSMNEDELKKLKIGLGDYWEDVGIMKKAGFTVITSATRTDLYRKLEAGESDGVSRSVYEAEEDLKGLEKLHPDMTIEPNIMLFYPSCYFFYVNKNEAQLAQRLRKGFQKIIENKKMDSIFKKYFSFDEAKIISQKRKIFKFNNEDFVDGPYTQDKSRWYLKQLEAK